MVKRPPPPSEDPWLFGDVEYVHEQIFFTIRNAKDSLVLSNHGFFKSDQQESSDIDGMARAENFEITDKNIGNYTFGKVYTNIDKKDILKARKGFGSGDYNIGTNNCQDFVTVIRGSKN